MRVKVLPALISLVATMTLSAQAQMTAIDADIVSGLHSGDSVNVDEEVRWNLLITNNYSDATSEAKVGGSTNGFRVFTKRSRANPATAGYFEPITYDTIAAFQWKAKYDLIFQINRFSIDGLGEDTVGFGGAALGGPGIAFGTTSEPAFTIATTPREVGDTLCLDSITVYPPGNPWLWSMRRPDLTQFSIAPDWGGPYCYHVYGAMPNLVVTPDSLFFSAVEGGPNPSSQPISVNADIAPVDFALSNTQTWLNYSPTGGTTDQVVDVSVDITGLTPDTLFDTIVVTSASAGNSPQHVIVVLEIQPGARFLAVDPDTVYFTAVENGPNPTPDTFAVSETGGANIGFNLLETVTWFSLDKASGTTPEDVEVSVNTSGLVPGPYFDSVEVSSAEADNSPLYAYVSLLVEQEPETLLVVNPDTLSFTAVENGGNPDPKTFNVSEAAAGTIPFSLTESVTWLSLNKTVGTTPEDVEVSIDITGLSADSYFDSVQVSSGNADNSPQFCYVALEVLSEPETLLVVDPDTLSFSVFEGDPSLHKDIFNVSEAGGGNIAFSLSESVTWFSLDKAGGTTPEDVEVSVDVSGLAPNTYFDSVTVTAAAADNSPQFAYVRLTVIPAAETLLVVSPDTLSFSAIANGPNPDPDSFLVSEIGGANIPFSLAESVDWFSLNKAGGTTPEYATVNVDVTGLTADTYFDSVEVSSAEADNSPQFAFISLEVAAELDTLLAVEPDTLYFAAVENGANPPSDGFLVSEVGGANIGFNLSETATWFSLNKASGTTPEQVVVSVVITGLAADTYIDSIEVSSGVADNSPVYEYVVLEVEPAPVCVDMILSDTIFSFTDTLVPPAREDKTQTFDITSSGDPFCFDITCDPPATWLTINPTSDCAPSTVSLSVNPSGLAAGQYVAVCEVLGDETVCDPNPRNFVVVYDIVDTTVVVLGDTVTVATVPAMPGQHVMVPVAFRNSCELAALYVKLQWNSMYLTLDSVSFAESRVAGLDVVDDTIDYDTKSVILGAYSEPAGPTIGPGVGSLANLYFTLDLGTPHGFYEIDLYVCELKSFCVNRFFWVNCGSGWTGLTPEFIPGGIVVGATPIRVCGYVVDTNWQPIPNASVELWASFPAGSPEDMTTSDGSGYFAFVGGSHLPFDLWAHKDGYYPGLVEGINYGDTGVTIVLTPVGPVFPTQEWVNYFCSTNTYMGHPLPVGSVVDAYDPDGIHCGTFYVHTPGRYGFMPVYADEPYNPGDQGAEPGDPIRFYVNGMEAVTSGNTVWTVPFDTNEVCLEAGVEVTHICHLSEGWNLVSWRVDHSSDYILDALASILDNVKIVLGFEQGGLTYMPGLEMFSTLWYVDHLSGYWINLKTDATLEITGVPVPTNTPIQVYSGWNLVSYLPDFELPTPEALSSVHDDLIVALGYDGVGLTYVPGEILYNTLDSMGPCFGYWLKMTRGGQLVYPTEGPIVVASKNSETPVLNACAPGVKATRHWLNMYSYNLTMNGEPVRAGSQVAAHSLDGTQVGGFTMAEDGTFGFMAVYADDPGTPDVDGVKPGERFYLSVDGVATNETFVWTRTGDHIEIAASLTGTTSGSDDALPSGYVLSQNYPNPFNPSTQISFTVPTTMKARIEVFNILGNLVATPFDGTAQAGSNTVAWDGRNSAGHSVASGIYFYRLIADKYVETKKMTLMK